MPAGSSGLQVYFPEKYNANITLCYHCYPGQMKQLLASIPSLLPSFLRFHIYNTHKQSLYFIIILLKDNFSKMRNDFHFIFPLFYRCLW